MRDIRSAILYNMKKQEQIDWLISEIYRKDAALATINQRLTQLESIALKSDTVRSMSERMDEDLAKQHEFSFRYEDYNIKQTQDIKTRIIAKINSSPDFGYANNEELRVTINGFVNELIP